MASATRKKPKPPPKPARKTAPRRPAIDPLAGITGPERAAPPLAEVDEEALEFIAAIDRFKKENARPFPSWSEILLIVRQLGYKRA